MNGSEPDEVGKKTPGQSLFLILQGNGLDSENHAAHTKVANLVSFFSYGGLASSPLPEDIGLPDEEDESGWHLVTNKKSQKESYEIQTQRE
jgi:hypothetical protein